MAEGWALTLFWVKAPDRVAAFAENAGTRWVGEPRVLGVRGYTKVARVLPEGSSMTGPENMGATMNSSDRYTGRNDHLKRLAKEYYQGQAYVHWSMTMKNRKTGWLIPIVYYKFREILTHTAFRYGICTPIYCCMPDHLHLLWVGIDLHSDQLLAARFFRKHMNLVLAKIGYRLQSQAYDHILREQERNQSAFEDIVEYIARNPERAGLVKQDRFRDYSYTACLVPGYPELHLWEADYWENFWRTYAYLSKNRCGLRMDESLEEES